MVRKDKDKQRLMTLWEELGSDHRRSLLDFAGYLSHSSSIQMDGGEAQHKKQPVEIDRPENENIVQAIKRLRTAYSMLNMDELLDETSTLMSQHMVHGRDAVAVIDDLETLFDKHFQKYLQS